MVTTVRASNDRDAEGPGGGSGAGLRRWPSQRAVAKPVATTGSQRKSALMRRVVTDGRIRFRRPERSEPAKTLDRDDPDLLSQVVQSIMRKDLLLFPRNVAAADK